MSLSAGIMKSYWTEFLVLLFFGCFSYLSSLDAHGEICQRLDLSKCITDASYTIRLRLVEFVAIFRPYVIVFKGA